MVRSSAGHVGLNTENKPLLTPVMFKPQHEGLSLAPQLVSLRIEGY